MEMVKGASVKFSAVFYSVWTGDTATSILANLTGGSGKLYVKNRDGDSDANALFVKNGTITDAVNGAMDFLVAAADTNLLSYQNLVCEFVAKDNTGAYIRSGVLPFTLVANVGKTLF
jgi:hypothetical protein